jgi:PEP-CTERM motif
MESAAQAPLEQAVTCMHACTACHMLGQNGLTRVYKACLRANTTRRNNRMSMNFRQILTGVALTAVCMAAQAVTKLEIDSHGAIGNDPYAFGVPWERKATTVYTTADGNFSIRPSYIEGANGYAALLNFQTFDAYAPGSTRISLDFATAEPGEPLAVGVYEGAQRFGFNDPGRPGLDYTNTGGGFNTLSGRFEVFDVSRDSQGNFISFAASFEIFNYPAPAGSPLVSGRVWFNSDVTIPAVPEPQTWMMGLLGLAGLAGAVRQKHRAAA